MVFVGVFVVYSLSHVLPFYDPLEPARLLCPWDSPGKNTGVGCHALLQSLFRPRDQTSAFVSCVSIRVLYH